MELPSCQVSPPAFVTYAHLHICDGTDDGMDRSYTIHIADFAYELCSSLNSDGSRSCTL